MSISTKLVSLIEDLTTPLTIKSWLIPLFEHMTHDATVSMKVCFSLGKEFCFLLYFD
jgi:hypothetical protein